jgi:hypothetical protein
MVTIESAYSAESLLVDQHLVPVSRLHNVVPRNAIFDPSAKEWGKGPMVPIGLAKRRLHEVIGYAHQLSGIYVRRVFKKQSFLRVDANCQIARLPELRWLTVNKHK